MITGMRTTNLPVSCPAKANGELFLFRKRPDGLLTVWLIASFLCLALLLPAKPSLSSTLHNGGGPDRAELVHHFSQSTDPEDFESIEDWEAYVQELMDLFPININTATEHDLLLIPGMTLRLAHNIVAHRKERRFSIIDDLTSVPGIGPATTEMFRPWVSTGSQRRGHRGWTNGFGTEQYFRYQQSFPTAVGYHGTDDRPAQFAGSPARLYHRQAVTTAGISANLTQVKLPGEPYHPPYGFDFTSAHLAYHGGGMFRRIVIGDYSARFGQGLVLWSNASFGKGGPAHTAPFKRSQGITPYRSSGQIRFFRGAAAEVSVPLPRQFRQSGSELTLSIMRSSRNRSAVEVDGDTIRPPSGNPYHRTESELARRNNVRENVLGANLSWMHPKWKLGFTRVSYRLDRPVMPHPNSSPFPGAEHQASGVDGWLRIGLIRIYGEFAWITNRSLSAEPYHADTDKTAVSAGIMASFPEGAEWILAVREFGTGYWSEYGNGFGEGAGVPTNQSGWYFGYRLRPSVRLHLTGFLDRFRFPVATRGNIWPGHGWEANLQIQYRQRPELQHQLGFRYKERAAELEVLDDFHRRTRIPGTSARLTGRYQVNWQVHRKLFLRSRSEAVLTVLSDGIASQKPSHGIAFSTSVRWQPSRRLRIDWGWTLFDTDDFSARLYQYEYDLTQVMTSRMLHGLGRTSYAVIRFRPFHWLQAELKYSRIRYHDRPVVGSGHDQTAGPVRSELGIQIRFAY